MDEGKGGWNVTTVSRLVAWVLILTGVVCGIVAASLGTIDLANARTYPTSMLTSINAWPLVAVGAIILAAGVTLEITHLRRRP
ncbi:MAG: hypothetical protein IT460_02775 [Planctomycetes bacterium]|nr:hypothetical protein [Planctomycetota bacterium]